MLRCYHLNGKANGFVKVKIRLQFISSQSTNWCQKNLLCCLLCSCMLGFFGEPLSPGGNCSRCQCNNNSDVCDTTTGRCLNCQYNTTGFHCERCENGTWGDALTQQCQGNEYPCLQNFTFHSEQFSNSCLSCNITLVVVFSRAGFRKIDPSYKIPSMFTKSSFLPSPPSWGMCRRKCNFPLYFSYS